MMPRLLCFGLIAAVCAAAETTTIEHRVEKKFTVPPGATLTLDTFTGAINVTETDGNMVEVTLREECGAKDEAAAAPKFANLEVSMEQKDRQVAVKVAYGRKATFTWEEWPPVRLTFDIKVPRQCDADLHTFSGDITVGKLKGRLNLQNDSGTIFAGETDGTVTARSRRGDIDVTACTGMIDAFSVSGNLQIGRTPGGARLASDGGLIGVQQAGGDFKVSGNGSEVQVRFAGALAHAADVATSGGSITAIFDTNLAATLDAEASPLSTVTARGLAPAGLPDGVTRASLTAKLNGGGPAVVLRAAGGHVLLRGVEPMPPAEPAP
jgi:hypothetical protein